MILEHGVVRTMDASLPAAALAIAGDRIAGGVGTHETALPTPERVDLGGRCVPRPTATCTSRPGRSPGTTSGSKTSRRWPRRSSTERRAGTAPGYGVPAGATPTGRHDPRLQPWTPSPATIGGAVVGTTTRSGSTRRRCARRWRSRGGRRRRRAGRGGAPTGVLREEAAWNFRERFVTVSEEEWVSDPGRSECRERARRRRGPRQGRLARRGIYRPHPRARRADAPRLAVVSSRARGCAGRPPAALARGRRLPPVRLPEGVHGRDARPADSVAARRLGAGITSGEELVEIIRAGARAGRWRCTRSATAPTARRSTPSPRRASEWQPLGLRQRIEHAQRLAPEDVGRFAEIGVACSVQFSHAPSDRDLAERLA